jgi:hypothetical protein
MDEKPSYGWALLATFAGAIIATIVMAVPHWLWTDFVLDQKFSAIVGRAEELSTWDRILLYGGDLLIVFAGLAVWAWTTRGMYNVFEERELKFWDVFLALATTGILAAIIGYFFPFVGLLIVVFLTPAVVNSWGGGYAAETSVGDRGAPRDQPMTALRPY